MEQLEIHSKSYLVRWVDVKAGSTISWSIQPHKKSIHFGIFKHPGAGIAPTPKLPLSNFEGPPTPALQPADAAQDLPQQRNASSAAVDKLKSIGLKEISWYGACEANRVTTGRWDVPEGEAGMYGLVFDNTFSKQLSKSVTFVLLTFPTSSFPPINHHIQGRPTINGRNSDHQNRRIKMGRQRESSDSIPQSANTTLLSTESRNESQQQGVNQRKGANDSNFFTGILQKRRRKRHQGFARRFFSLDFSTATLSYYHNRHTSAIRGAIPLSLAAIGANGKARDISIDSGAEIWHLKATNARDFEAWKNALELARTSHSPASPANGVKTDASGRTILPTQVNPEEEKEWEKVENLVNRLQESRKTARLLAKDTDPRYLPLDLPRPPFERKSTASSASDSPSEHSLSHCVSGGSQRRPFWRRKPSGEKSFANPTSSRSVSAQPATTPSPSIPSTPDEAATPGPINKTLASHAEESLHEHSLAILQNLDNIASEFAILMQQSKQRRHPARPMPVSTPSRYSLDSLGDSQEFYDAESGESSQLLAIQHETDEEEEEEKSDQPEVSDEDSASEAEGSGSEDIEEAPQPATPSAYPSKPKSLTPLPAKWVKRRTTVTAPTVPVPSLISFLRKNVGKDLSTISMPASSNEPLSFLQRASEQMEYSQLLDSAAKTDDKSSSTLRLLYITAFAISTFSYARIKERAIRKPFNPMLGETFELVREDRGFRFVSEKVSHRPVRMACQAESENWSFAQAPAPTQKFWGKSAELVTEGRVRVILYSTGDRFVWTPATSFLRNIIAGEKYVEPVGTMTVTNESTGEHALVTFKSKGMFSGRSEDVVVETKDRFGDPLPLGLVGKWTHSLTLTENGDPTNAKFPNNNNSPIIWQVDDAPPEASKRYGFTAFAASLNEITALEKDKIPPTDSRLRPDQRYLENNSFEEAERVKARLEEAQRRRRREMGDEGGEGWRARWFEKVEGVGGGEEEEVWVLREGAEGYWERRGRGAWGGGERVFDE
ncbi:MAG: hypothetical protein LQ350_004761 [Teloschistes chrysophthalmus]|nr:MAG: hypothetical protein LQ350_004761 [Niorma chrysophthalma]